MNVDLKYCDFSPFETIPLVTFGTLDEYESYIKGLRRTAFF